MGFKLSDDETNKAFLRFKDLADKKKEIALRLRNQETRRLGVLAARTKDAKAELYAWCEAEVAALDAKRAEARADAEMVEAADQPEPVAAMIAGALDRAVAAEADQPSNACPRCSEAEELEFVATRGYALAMRSAQVRLVFCARDGYCRRTRSRG